MDYDKACRRAATEQGLDPVTEALRDAGVEHAVEQTGGFCMVVTVARQGGTWGVTADGGAAVYWYPGDAWREAEPGFETNVELADWGQVAALVSTPPAASSLRP